LDVVAVDYYVYGVVESTETLPSGQPLLDFMQIQRLSASLAL